MRVKVEKDHITNGTAKNSQHCMIADAIQDACPTARFIMVDLQSIRFSDKATRKRYVYMTPPIAQSNLLKFDQGKSVKPFVFNLKTPVCSRTMDARTDASTPRRKAVTKKARAKYAKNQKKADYGYLAANRARNHQKERGFGLRKFVA
jgi:hypothetical protein